MQVQRAPGVLAVDAGYMTNKRTHLFDEPEGDAAEGD